MSGAVTCAARFFHSTTEKERTCSFDRGADLAALDCITCIHWVLAYSFDVSRRNMQINLIHNVAETNTDAILKD